MKAEKVKTKTKEDVSLDDIFKLKYIPKATFFHHIYIYFDLMQILQKVRDQKACFIKSDLSTAMELFINKNSRIA